MSQQTIIKGSGDADDTSVSNTVKTGSDVVGVLSVLNIFEHTPVGKAVALADSVLDFFYGVPSAVGEVAGADAWLQVAVGSVSLGAAVVEKTAGSAGVLAESGAAGRRLSSLQSCENGSAGQ